MKKTIILLSLLLTALTLSAATFYTGAEGGLTFNSIAASKGYRSYDYGMAMGFKASVPVVVTFSDNLGLETGISFYSRNYSYSQNVKNDSGEMQSNFDLVIQNGFITLPVMFRFSIPAGDFDFYTSLGGFAGFWLYGKRDGSVRNGNDRTEEVSERTDLSLYNRFEAGVSLKIGADMNFGSFRGYVEGEYDFSLTDMNKDQKYGAYRVHNSTFSVTLGILWGINK